MKTGAAPVPGTSAHGEICRHPGEIVGTRGDAGVSLTNCLGTALKILMQFTSSVRTRNKTSVRPSTTARDLESRDRASDGART